MTSERDLARSGPIAVVGLGCRFPGGADTPEAFWRVLESGADVIRPMEWDRFDVDRFYDPVPGSPGKIAAAEGGFLDRIDEFDAAFFSISPREAKKIDPQHRLLLEVAWEAMEDGGVVPSSLSGPRTGVYVGIWSGEYENVMYRNPDALDFHSVTGGGRYSASGRLSWAYDLRGPCVTVDSGCSASLSAVHMACNAMALSEIDAAVVGAANLILQPHISIAYSRSGMLSTGGRCRFGDANATGYVRSDGVAAVILKPLARAIQDGDRIRGVILGTMVNADGRASGQLATPSEDAQRELLEVVYPRAGVDPGAVPYVEAHGTGTRAGDPVELGALGAVLGRNRPEGRPLLVGSVKTNIGHTEATAGMAGLMKTLLSLERRWIPASLHHKEPNPDIPWEELSLAVPTEGRAWPDGEIRVAGVSSFGITGTNAHAVVAAYEPEGSPPPEPISTAGARVVALSARSEDAVRRSAARLREALREPEPPSLDDISYTTTCRREHLPHRVAAVVETREELADALGEAASPEAGGRLFWGVAAEHARPRIAFVFSGQGSQWAGMGRELRASYPAFDETISEAEAVLASMVDWSLGGVLAGDDPMDSIDVIQPVLAVIQIALARQLMDWGVIPDAVLGHSMGEVPAAHVAGALSLADALRVLVVRSRLLKEISGQGAMALADEVPEAIEARLERFDGAVSVAAVNGPRSTVISGDPDDVDALLAELEAEGTFCQRVRVDVASHSAQTEPLLPRLGEELSALDPSPSRHPFHSTVLAGPVDGEQLGPDYWKSNLRRPVRLAETVGALVEDGVDVFIEISPHPILLTSLKDIAAESGRRPAMVPLLRREEPETRRLAEASARLHVVGVPVDWSAIAAPGALPVRLPGYPWEKESHWIENWEDWGEGGASGIESSVRPEDADGLLYRVDWIPVPPEGTASAPGDVLVVSDRGGVGRRAAEGLRDAGWDVTVADGDTPTSASGAVGSLAAIIDLRALDASADGPGGVENALERACAEPLELARKLIGDGAAPRDGVWWVTCGAQSVGERAPTAASAPQAALWGLVRTSWQEHPELNARLVDLEPAGIEDMAAKVVEAFTDHRAEPQVGFAEGRAHAARLVRAPEAARSPARWSSDASYLITGGMGELGLGVAEEMVRGGARRLVLIGRTPLPPRDQWTDADLAPHLRLRIEGVLRLERMGAGVHVLAADVGDAAALGAALDRYRDERWPEIRGVIHCAGVLDNHLIRDLEWDAFMRVATGKAIGAWNLHLLLPDAEQMVFFSSLVPVLPQAGQANYAAANAFLDSLASARSKRGSPTVSLGWGVWDGMGLVRDAQVSRSVNLMEEQGIRRLSPLLGQALFHWTAGSKVSHVALAPIDWERVAARVERRPGAAFYGDLLAGAGVEDVERFGVEVRGLPEGQRRSALADRLRSMVAQILGVGAEALPVDQPLGRRGLDSLMAMELRNRLETALDLRLPASVVWNYPTIEALADHLLGLLNESPAPEERGATGDGGEAASASEEPIDVEAWVAEVTETSEDDVLRLLREDS